MMKYRGLASSDFGLGVVFMLWWCPVITIMLDLITCVISFTEVVFTIASWSDMGASLPIYLFLG